MVVPYYLVEEIKQDIKVILCLMLHACFACTCAAHLKDNVLVAIAVGAAKRIAVVGRRSSVQNHWLVARTSQMILDVTPLRRDRGKQNKDVNQPHSNL